MDSKLRDYLLESFAILNGAQNAMSENMLLAHMNHTALKILGALRYRTAQLYHALANEKDLSILDDAGHPNKFQRKRIEKMIQQSTKEFMEKVSSFDGKSNHTSLKHGGIIASPDHDKNTKCSCGEDHE